MRIVLASFASFRLIHKPLVLPHPNDIPESLLLPDGSCPKQLIAPGLFQGSGMGMFLGTQLFVLKYRNERELCAYTVKYLFGFCVVKSWDKCKFSWREWSRIRAVISNWKLSLFIPWMSPTHEKIYILMFFSPNRWLETIVFQQNHISLLCWNIQSVPSQLIKTKNFTIMRSWLI